MANRLFAIGDIHGCFDQFRTLFEDKMNALTNDRIILLGDYIDRGEKSREVIDYIMSLKENGFNIITLIGNHEIMLLDALDSGDPSLWLWNGGTETMNSFNIDSLKSLDPKYISFFENLQWFYSYENYLFVHAGFNDTFKNPFKDKMSMVWIRRENYYNPLLKNRIIVHGHSPVPLEICRENILLKKNVINIDTGCVYQLEGFGKLTAIELYSMTLYHA